MELLSNNKERLGILYRKLRGMVGELRGFYEEDSNAFSDIEDFTKMMLLDSCFIMYYIFYIFENTLSEFWLFKGEQIIYIHRDLFLMENQIPFKVLTEVMSLVGKPPSKLQQFVYGTIFSSPKPPKLVRWLQTILFCTRSVVRRGRWKSFDNNIDHLRPDHLLHLLHRIVTTKVESPMYVSTKNSYMCNYGTAAELVDIGIQFKPSEDKSACVKFVKGCLKLPPLTIDDSTKATWLNLIAFEKGLCTMSEWVTWYVCFLHSLVEQPEDVKVLRKAWLLGNYTSRDKNVVELFNEIATDLVPNKSAYSEVKNNIQMHYESSRAKLRSQLRHEYLKNPWSYLALLAASLALFFSGVQAYFTVWSPKSECDHLCKSLKINHHL